MFDMSQAAIALGSIETMMAGCGAVEVGNYLNIPTMNGAGVSDSKTVDAQHAIESTAGILLAALSRVNLSCGVGMINSLSSHSCESMIISHEVVGMARRLLDGINVQMDNFGLDVVRQVGHKGNFVETEHTLAWYKQESYFPKLIDRHSEGDWRALGSKDMLQRARDRIEELVAAYQKPELPDDIEKEINAIMGRYASKYGMAKLPKDP